MKIKGLGIVAMGMAAILVAGSAFASDDPPSFTALTNFPPAADGAYGVVADGLGDGRFVAYDGESVHVQDDVDADAFTAEATGLIGDPAFIATAPSGKVLVGTGVAGGDAIYLVDLAAPAKAAELKARISHFWAAYIDEDTLIVDRVVGNTSELGVLDISNSPAVYTKVVSGKGNGSAALAVSADGDTVYATVGYLSELGQQAGETRSFDVQDLLDAAATKAALAWTSGTRIGMTVYNAGGPSGISNLDTLLMGGAGSVQFVDPSDGTVAGNVVPTGGTAATFYSVAYNTESGKVLIIGTDFTKAASVQAYASDTAYEACTGFNFWQFLMSILPYILGLGLIIMLLFFL